MVTQDEIHLKASSSSMSSSDANETVAVPKTTNAVAEDARRKRRTQLLYQKHRSRNKQATTATASAPAAETPETPEAKKPTRLQDRRKNLRHKRLRKDAPKKSPSPAAAVEEKKKPLSVQTTTEATTAAGTTTPEMQQQPPSSSPSPSSRRACPSPSRRRANELLTRKRKENSLKAAAEKQQAAANAKPAPASPRNFTSYYKSPSPSRPRAHEILTKKRNKLLKQKETAASTTPPKKDNETRSDEPVVTEKEEETATSNTEASQVQNEATEKKSSTLLDFPPSPEQADWKDIEDQDFERDGVETPTNSFESQVGVVGVQSPTNSETLSSGGANSNVGVLSPTSDGATPEEEDMQEAESVVVGQSPGGDDGVHTSTSPVQADTVASNVEEASIVVEQPVVDMEEASLVTETSVVVVVATDNGSVVVADDEEANEDADDATESTSIVVASDGTVIVADGESSTRPNETTGDESSIRPNETAVDSVTETSVVAAAGDNVVQRIVTMAASDDHGVELVKNASTDTTNHVVAMDGPAPPEDEERSIVIASSSNSVIAVVGQEEGKSVANDSLLVSSMVATIGQASNVATVGETSIVVAPESGIIAAPKANEAAAELETRPIEDEGIKLTDANISRFVESYPNLASPFVPPTFVRKQMDMVSPMASPPPAQLMPPSSAAVDDETKTKDTTFIAAAAVPTEEVKPPQRNLTIDVNSEDTSSEMQAVVVANDRCQDGVDSVKGAVPNESGKDSSNDNGFNKSASPLAAADTQEQPNLAVDSSWDASVVVFDDKPAKKANTSRDEWDAFDTSSFNGDEDDFAGDMEEFQSTAGEDGEFPFKIITNPSMEDAIASEHEPVVTPRNIVERSTTTHEKKEILYKDDVPLLHHDEERSEVVNSAEKSVRSPPRPEDILWSHKQRVKTYISPRKSDPCSSSDEESSPKEEQPESSSEEEEHVIEYVSANYDEAEREEVPDLAAVSSSDDPAMESRSSAGDEVANSHAMFDLANQAAVDANKNPQGGNKTSLIPSVEEPPFDDTKIIFSPVRAGSPSTQFVEVEVSPRGLRKDDVFTFDTTQETSSQKDETLIKETPVEVAGDLVSAPPPPPPPLPPQGLRHAQRNAIQQMPPPPPPPPPPKEEKRSKKKKKSKKKKSKGGNIPLIAPPPEEKLKKWEESKHPKVLMSMSCESSRGQYSTDAEDSALLENVSKTEDAPAALPDSLDLGVEDSLNMDSAISSAFVSASSSEEFDASEPDAPDILEAFQTTDVAPATEANANGDLCIQDNEPDATVNIRSPHAPNTSAEACNDRVHDRAGHIVAEPDVSPVPGNSDPEQMHGPDHAFESESKSEEHDDLYAGNAPSLEEDPTVSDVLMNPLDQIVAAARWKALDSQARIDEEAASDAERDFATPKSRTTRKQDNVDYQERSPWTTFDSSPVKDPIDFYPSNAPSLEEDATVSDVVMNPLEGSVESSECKSTENQDPAVTSEKLEPWSNQAEESLETKGVRIEGQQDVPNGPSTSSSSSLFYSEKDRTFGFNRKAKTKSRGHDSSSSSLSIEGAVSNLKMAEKIALASSVASQTFEERYGKSASEESMVPSPEKPESTTEEVEVEPSPFLCSPRGFDVFQDSSAADKGLTRPHDHSNLPKTRQHHRAGLARAISTHKDTKVTPDSGTELRSPTAELVGGAFRSWTSNDIVYGSDFDKHQPKPISDAVREPTEELEIDISDGVSPEARLLFWLEREVLGITSTQDGSKRSVDELQTILEKDEALNTLCRYVAERINEKTGANKRVVDDFAVTYDRPREDDDTIPSISTNRSSSTLETFTMERAEEFLLQNKPMLHPFQIPLDQNGGATVAISGVLAANFVSFLQRTSKLAQIDSPFGDENPFISELLSPSIENEGDGDARHSQKSMQSLVFGHPKGNAVAIVQFMLEACRPDPEQVNTASFETTESMTGCFARNAGPQDGASNTFVFPKDGPSPFEAAINENPDILALLLGFLGDPQSVCRVKMVNRSCKSAIEDNEHVIFRDAVRLGGMSMHLRPAFWMWLALEKCGDDDETWKRECRSEDAGVIDDINELERIGLSGKWHNVIERDVARSFGNMPPHKTGARLKRDSIVRALVTWGKSKISRKSSNGEVDVEPTPRVTNAKKSKSRTQAGRRTWANGDDDSNASDVSQTPTDTVSDWGGVSPVGSFMSACTPTPSETGRPDALKTPSASDISTGDSMTGELALSGNTLTPAMKLELQEKLSYILHALAAAHPDVGYCQGMDYVVAHLLRVLQDTVLLHALRSTLPAVIRSGHEAGSSTVVEEVVFRVMNRFLTTYNLRHMYWPELRCLKTCCRVFEKLIQRKLPVLADHFDHHELNIGLFALGWFQTLFLYLPSMPSATVCHMWDIWLVERSFKIFFRVGTAILFLSQPILLNHELEGMMTYLNTFPDATLLNPDILIACALQIKVTNKMLLELEMEVARENDEEGIH